MDAEAVLRRSRRPLVLGIGGGGDVVGALATAEFARLYDHADPVVGGLTWERRPVDPFPGPRAVEEIVDAVRLAPGILLAGPDTRVRDSGIHFAESRMAQFLGRETVLVDIHAGPRAIAEALAEAMTRLGCDLAVFIDVGGDVLARGQEPGLRSPLCDAVMLAAAVRLADGDLPVIAGVFGACCDGELTLAELSAQLAEVSRGGGGLGVRGLTEPVAARLEAAMSLVTTEASALAVSAFRGHTGVTTIRGGAVAVEVTPLAAQTVYLDAAVTFASAAPLARAVAQSRSLDGANRELHRLGVRTELDLERDSWSRSMRSA
jgi:hypothetical protein